MGIVDIQQTLFRMANFEMTGGFGYYLFLLPWSVPTDGASHAIYRPIRDRDVIGLDPRVAFVQSRNVRSPSPRDVAAVCFGRCRASRTLAAIDPDRTAVFLTVPPIDLPSSAILILETCIWPKTLQYLWQTARDLAAVYFDRHGVSCDPPAVDLYRHGPSSTIPPSVPPASSLLTRDTYFEPRLFSFPSQPYRAPPSPRTTSPTPPPFLAALWTATPVPLPVVPPSPSASSSPNLET
mmetsp:Transcript_11519/g.20718  ORF Transcript_11519/g.20718 Transcript_11519/m.20718 type:complete len:237 (-) Transcript_11519:690-1400(-)